MRTIFEIKDERAGDTNFSAVTRWYYKRLIRAIDRRGIPFRVGTLYVNGYPIKQLTILKAAS